MGGQGVGLICNWLFLWYVFPSPWAVLRPGPGLTPLRLETTEEGPPLPTKPPRGSSDISWPHPHPVLPNPGSGWQCWASGHTGCVPPRGVPFPEGRHFLPEALPTLRFSGAPQEPPPLPQARGLPPSVLPVSGAHTQLPAGTQHQGSSCETSHMFRGTPALGALPPPCSHPPLLPQESSLLLSAPTSELAQKCFSRPT